MPHIEVIPFDHLHPENCTAFKFRDYSNKSSGGSTVAISGSQQEIDALDALLRRSVKSHNGQAHIMAESDQHKTLTKLNIEILKVTYIAEISTQNIK